MESTAKRLLPLFAILTALVPVPMHGADLTPRKPAAGPGAELAAAARIVGQRGLHAELPPHISALLGLTRDEKCAVLQGVVRSGGKIQGIEVAQRNPRDIVIFAVDEATQGQTFYLTSPSGQLRRVLAVTDGVGRVVKPTREDLQAFENEKKMWNERLAIQPPAR